MNPSKKDVIYIDIEDDITAIIGKIKDANSKIVALVPPKRIGVLQSAVNLKLLQKSAGESDRRVVLITSDHSLTALAAGLKIPVAKNLQSRPEIPQMESPDMPDEEVIDGESLPVGELAAAASAQAAGVKAATPTSAADEISSQVDLRNLPKDDTKSLATAAKGAGKAKGPKKPFVKIPNFNDFRKKFFIIGGAAVVLIIFLIWAFAIAPHATVTINAKTTAVSIDQTLSIDPTLAQSSVQDLKFKGNAQQIKKSVSADFTATGTKDTGTKATGTVTLTNGNDSNTKNVPAGTVMTASSGQRFVSTSGATVPGASVSGGSIVPGKAQVNVEAADIGTEYNVPAQGYTVSGYESLSASGSDMKGGDKKTITVVSQDDVDKAKSGLAQQDSNSIKSDLKKQFSKDYLVIDESFNTSQGDPSVSPAVGQEATKAKLTVDTTYSLVGLARSDVDQLLNSALKSALDAKADQSIYRNGSDKVSFANFQKFDTGTYSTRLSTTGYIGAKIDTASLAKQLAGKRQGEIQAIVDDIPNVGNVDIKFSPFWVNSAPGDPKKIDIKFTVSNDSK